MSWLNPFVTVVAALALSGCATIQPSAPKDATDALMRLVDIIYWSNK